MRGGRLGMERGKSVKAQRTLYDLHLSLSQMTMSWGQRRRETQILTSHPHFLYFCQIPYKVEKEYYFPPSQQASLFSHVLMF